MKLNSIEFSIALIRKGLTATELAKITGVSRGTISAAKNGKTVSKQTATKLTEVLGNEIFQSNV